MKTKDYVKNPTENVDQVKLGTKLIGNIKL